MVSAPLLNCFNISMSFGTVELFSSLSLSIHPGDRLGVIGANGSGKTTLFKILCKQLEPHSGSVAVQSGIKIAVITQFFDLGQHGEITVSQFLEKELPLEVNLDKKRATIEHEISELASQASHDEKVASSEAWTQKLNDLHDALLKLEGAGTSNIIESVLKSGNLLHLASRSVFELSGGEQKRLQIVSALVKSPQLIFLDEPTNHLDIETVEWLESFLLNVALDGTSFLGIKNEADTQEPCAFVLVSHDRALLDTLVTKILELDRGVWSLYNGNFENYVEERIKRDAELKKTRDKMANLFCRELAWLRAGVKARTTKQTARIERAHSLQDQLKYNNNRLQKNALETLDFGAILSDQSRDESDTLVPILGTLGEQELLKLKSLNLLHPGYDTNKKLICRDLTLTLKPRMRIALLGANGCGKSTLLNAIYGHYTGDFSHSPMDSGTSADTGADTGAEALKRRYTGEIAFHELAEVIYFDQHRQLLDGKLTLRETLCPKGDYVRFSGRNIHIMAYLDQFLFSKHSANLAVEKLSGGEQARLLLAKLMLESGNILLLDEPTNDLDIPTLQLLEKSLQNYKGGVLFTSHDRYFIQRVATHVMAFEGDSKNGEGDFGVWQMYADLEQALNAMEAKTVKQESQSSKKSENKAANAVPPPAAKPKLTYQEKKELEKLEKNIHELELVISNNENELSALYEQGAKYEVTNSKEKDIKEQKKNLEAFMARWEILFEKS